MKLSIFDNLFGVKTSDKPSNPVLPEMNSDFKPIKPAHDILDFSYPKASPFYKPEPDIPVKSGHDIHTDFN